MTTAPQDYNLFTSSVTFASEQMIRIVPVSIVNDDKLESLENFTVMITGQNRVEGGQIAQVFIYDDDSETGSFSQSTYMNCICNSSPSCLPPSLPTSLPACLPVCLFICLPICLSVCLSVCPSVCLCVYLSVCLSVHLFVCLSVCLSACLISSPWILFFHFLPQM